MTEASLSAHDEEFYLRWREGHERDQMEFILTPSGKLKYANKSAYRNGHRSNQSIFKEVYLSPAVVDEFKRIVLESGIQNVDDSSWDAVNDNSKVRIQELEIKIGNTHLAFTTEEIGSLAQVLKSNDPDGLQLFYYLAQDLKTFVYSLISLHFKIKPIPR